MIKSLLAGAALSLCLVGAATAATYDVTFDGDTADFSAQIVTDAFDQMTSITGSFVTGAGTDAITGFVALDGQGDWYDASWNWDNAFGAATPWVTNGGILFTTAGGASANLFLDGGNYVLSYKYQAGNGVDNYIPGAVSSTLSVAPVPLPAAGLLLVGGLGALGAIKRRRKAA